MAIKFKPVRGTEAQIKEMDVNNGYFYIAVDTGKMYLDTNERRIMVGGSGSGGGNSSILYAKSDAINEHEDGFFHISINDLEDNNNINLFFFSSIFEETILVIWYLISVKYERISILFNVAFSPASVGVIDAKSET